MNTAQAEREVVALMIEGIARQRPELAGRLSRSALTPKQIADVVAAVDAQERAGRSEFSRAFPELARAAVEEAEADEDPSVSAYLARMRRLDEELVAEERELGRRLRGHGR